jgi:hypothetical protein
LRGSVVRLVRTAIACTMVLAVAAPVRAARQEPVTVRGTVLDREAGAPVSDATVMLRPAGAAGGGALVRTTGSDGTWVFAGLKRGRYGLTVERVGYESASLDIALEREAPMVVTITLEPVPFPLDALIPGRTALRGPSLVARSIVARGPDRDGRARSVRHRQQHFLASDVRQLSHADLREANTLAEDDILRAFQRSPGVAARDDYGADLWTRGAPAGQTLVFFDGIPLIGGMHALGVLGGLNSDMLTSATFHPGVATAALQGAGAGLIDVASRSRADGGSATVAVSPITARASASGALSEAVGWSFGLRRSYVDAVSALATDALPGGSLPYAFGDMTGRLDAALGRGARVEASFFWQADRVFGDVRDLAWGNDGGWGAHAARATYVKTTGSSLIRVTLGTSGFDASVRAATPSGGHSPLHPNTESHYHTVVVEGRLDSPTGWSAGVRASRELQEYNGPGIDLARLLAPDELRRRGQPELTPIIMELERSRLLKTDGMTRVAAWAERRGRIAGPVEVEAGLRIESGDPLAGSAVRMAPRLRARFMRDGSPFSLSAAYGRAWQYVQSVARTDVLRTGLRANEVFVQAGEDTPALRSDMVTLGAEAWAGTAWLFGATAWLRDSGGILLPEPTPGVIDESRPLVGARGRAQGVELSARRLEGRVRGFANYTWSRSRHRVGEREFDASEDRRHVANIGVVADVLPRLMLGATARAMSGSPYTRVTLIDTDCERSLSCSRLPVLVGTPSGQRSPGWSSIDLMAEWTRAFDSWSVSLYGQLRNAAGSPNPATYHSSCLCVNGVGANGASLSDRFDRGLPRLPILGLRARF